jgi:hypothetical protein
MNKLKTINIKGKQYVEVHERLKYFRTNFKDWALTTEVIEKTDTSILIQANAINPEGITKATGLAEEEKGSTFINKTSYVENAETSAIGRCLGCLGIGIDSGVASYEEVSNATVNQKDTMTKYTLDIGDENWSKVLRYIAENKKQGIDKLVSNLKIKYDITAPVKKELIKISKLK